jgi:type I restriction enzyme, S subunit
MKVMWRTKKLSDVLEVQNGYAFDSKEFSTSDGIPLIRIRDLKVGTETETRFVGKYEDKYLVKAGDLLIGMDGEFGCFEWKGGPALLNQRVCRLQGFTSDLLPRFLYHGVNTHLKAIEEVTGFATVKHLSSKQILNIEFPLPPLAEQERIVGILDKAFHGIATAKVKAEENLQNTRGLFESHLQRAFTRRDEKWVERPLGEIASFRNGLNYTKDSKGESVKIVGVKDFQKNFSVPLDNLDTVTIDGILSDIDTLKQGDILAVRSNGNIDLIGRCILAGEVTEKMAHSGFTIRIRLTCEDVLPQYLCHFMKSAGSRKRLTEGGIGTNIKSLNQGMLSALAVPFPPVSAQKALIEKLEALSEETQRLASIYLRKLAALEALKKSLLHQAFNQQL